jgi:4-carboxymuconolactone decarboxylase
MTRIAILSREEMDAEQGAVYDAAKEAGRPLGGPYFAYIRIPELMRTTQEVGTSLAHIPLTKREQQIAILTIARFWGAKYPWAVQVRSALKIGLEQEIIDGINAQEKPPIADIREMLAYEIAKQMLENKEISSETYAAAEEAYSEVELVALVARIGAFTMTCCTANAFDVTPPEDAPSRLL